MPSWLQSGTEWRGWSRPSPPWEISRVQKRTPDPSEGSIHRTGPDHPARRRACSRSFETGEKLHPLHQLQMLPHRWPASSRRCWNCNGSCIKVCPSIPQSSPFRSRNREDYVPAKEQEVMKWMTNRQEEMNAAHMSGTPTEAARISG